MFGGAALSVVSLFIWISVNKDRNALVFGHVVRVNAAEIVIADREDRTTRVLVDVETIITDRLKKIQALDIPAGQFIQVSGKRLEKGVIDADTVRLMRGTRREFPPPPAQ